MSPKWGGCERARCKHMQPVSLEWNPARPSVACGMGPRAGLAESLALPIL